MIERQTAKKVRVRDLVNGTFIKREGFEPSFVTTQNGEDVSRARITATVVGKFTSEDGNYASITLDDGSDTIRAKAFKDLKILEKVNTGDLVDVIGRVREYNGEIYVMPEVIVKIEDPNYELLRRLELAYKVMGIQKTKELVEKNKDKFQNPEKLKKELTEKHGLEEQWVDIFLKKTQESEKNTIRSEILKMIEKNPDGIKYGDLAKKVKGRETELESVINELLSEGICYEPSPGKIRKI